MKLTSKNVLDNKNRILLSTLGLIILSQALSLQQQNPCQGLNLQHQLNEKGSNCRLQNRAAMVLNYRETKSVRYECTAS